MQQQQEEKNVKGCSWQSPISQSPSRKEKPDLRQYQGEDRVVSSIQWLAEHDDEPPFLFSLKSRIPALDRAVEGFREGELYTISGQTKQGKTTLARTLTDAFVKQQFLPLWFTYEVPPRQFLGTWQECPFFYIPRIHRGKSMAWFLERCEESFLKHGTRIIFIDHLHYLFDMAKSRAPSIDIGQIIRTLKTMAVTNGLLIFLLCHTSKGEPGAEPTYNDLRDCLPSGQRIYSEGKRIPIGETCFLKSVLARKSISTVQPGYITHHQSVGIRKVFKLTTVTGKKIFCSDGHKFYATTFSKAKALGPNQRAGIAGWIPLRELCSGQKIAVVKEYPDLESATISEDLALILGWLVGDGSVSRNYYSEITTSTEEEASLISGAVYREFGLRCKITPYRDKKAFRVYLTDGKNNTVRKDNPLRAFLSRIQYRATGKNKYVPELIFLQPRRIISAFLRGLFQSDGSINRAGVNKSECILTLFTISERLAEEVKHLLLRVGITAWLRNQNLKSSGFRTLNNSICVLSIYGQGIITFHEKIGFLGEKKVRENFILTGWKPREKKRSGNIGFERIKSIEYMGEQECFDISTNKKSFCVEDFLTHNSSFMAQESDSVIMIQRMKKTKHAKLYVEFHRRTGVVREIVEVQLLPSGLLGEPTERYEEESDWRGEK